jgi:glycosyltransferase involved in cell wall biosynthesis
MPSLPLTVTFVLPNLESGGTERQVLTLGRRMDRARFSPSLVTTAGGGSLYRDFSEILPVTVHGDPERGKRFRSSPSEHLATIRFLAKTFRGTRPDILHSFLPAANVLGPIAARLSGVRRVIVSKRGLANYKALFSLPRLVEPLGNRLADRILVNSDAVQRDVERTERNWGGKFRKIYNGVAAIAAWTEEERQAFRAREGIPVGARVVLCVSNFYPYKGHVDLIEAAGRVAPQDPDVVFLLVGRDAGTLEECRSLARERVPEHAIRFLGGRADVPDLIRVSDLFVHPSHEEGFSNAILEAMAGGKPVVAYDVGGNPEAVEDGETGLLVPVRRPEALADATVRLLRDPGLRNNMGEKGKERATEHFSLERMVREMEALYKSLMEEKA